MWAKFETAHFFGDAVFLPSSLGEKMGGNAKIKFGGGDTFDTDVKYTLDARPFEKSTFDNPMTIKISPSLEEKLRIQKALVYRIKIEDACIYVGPVIGLLLGVHTECYNPRHVRKYSDRMGIYNKIGGLIYAFSPKSVNWKKHEAFGLFYNAASLQWEYGCFPLPEVIYRRDFHCGPSCIKKLADFTGGRLFNSYRFSKMEFYDFLKKDEDMEKLLPPTEPSQNFEQLSAFIDRYEKAILKPVDLSRGRGMCIVEKKDGIYRVTDYRHGKQIESVFKTKEALEHFFDGNKSFFKKYLVQKYLNLAKAGGSMFDVRVVMQKTQDSAWGCTGIECRASNHSHITNISRGGFAMALPEALGKAFSEDHESIAEKILDACGKVCEKLDTMGHNFAELGVDIAVDESGNVYLIEANVFPSFKGFKITDRAVYYAIRYAPMLYALSLSRFGGD